MLFSGGMFSIPLFLASSVLLVCPLQSIDAQTLENNLTQTNITGFSSPTQWAIYTNDKFGFRIEHPQSWIIDEKQNRFESGVDLAIESPDISSPDYGKFTFIGPIPAPTNNIKVLTNLGIKETIGGFDVDYDARLIDDANVTKYKINGEQAGTFTYVLDNKDLDETEPIPFAVAEVVITVHNGKSHIFQFIASPENFDSPVLTDVRQHMFNSIKWLG